MKSGILLGMAGICAALTGCASPGGDQTATRPNIVFIMTDDHAYQAISAYGSKLINTPNIDKIAQQGIIFNKAFVTNSICAPSRAVILTGKFSHLNGQMDNSSKPFNWDQQNFAKILQRNGYQTALIGKTHLPGNPQGFDYWNIFPGFGDYYNPKLIKLGKDTIYQGYVTDILTELSVDWMENRDKNKPFCLMLHHKAPHRSWMPALKNLSLFDDKDLPLPENFYDNYEGREALKRQQLTVKGHMDIRLDHKVPCFDCETTPGNENSPADYRRSVARLNPEERKIWDEAYKKEETEFRQVKDDEKKYDKWKFRRYMEDYLRCIVSVDESVGEVLNFLSESGLDKNTIVIYTSDQGFFLGEHGLFDKRFMYEESFRTPLLMKFPGEIKEGTSSDLLVQNLDVAPTILDLAGANIPADMQGVSLRPAWKGQPKEWRDALYYHYTEKLYGIAPHYGVRTDRYKLIHFYDLLDSWEMYDLEKDPHEMHNIYNDPDYSDVRGMLQQRLTQLRTQYSDSSD
jgi:arylsulfatase A-like enzyme